jgi:pyruvate dehydrogenase E2 component (dihydrolipoamide acetyltransferase)
MATPVEMPKLGNTVEECLLARWCKHPGDAVAEGEIIAEIETDKATFEIISPVSGTLLSTFFQEGDLVPVYTNICVVGKPDENVDKFRPQPTTGAFAPKPQGKAGPIRQITLETTKSVPVPAQVADTPIPNILSPRAKHFSEVHHFCPKGITGTGPGGRVLEEDLKKLYYELPHHSSLAEQMIGSGYELRGNGSGPNGMVLSGDLTSPPTKMSTMRQRIARRMRDSLTTSAQYTMNASAVATGLMALRGRIKAREPDGFPSVNINEIVMFCAVKALMAMPEINVELVDGKIYQHTDIHIGFACDTPKGLLVPVIRNSQAFTLPELAMKIKALARQALEGSLTPDDLSGGTFTVSNLGTYGVESFSPILNPPQVAILGVNTIELKPVRRNGAIDFIEHIGLSLTCDHQIIDGAPGARFLKTVKEQIEGIENIIGKDIGFEILN